MVYEYWLAKMQGMSMKKKRQLREYFGDAKTIFNIEETKTSQIDFLSEKERKILSQAKRETNLEEEYEVLEKEKIRFIPWHDSHYPQKLRNISHPPYALYVKGRLPDEKKPAVAIVGARNATPYGETFAMEYGQALAKCDVQIISGMARGIDASGQRGALNVSGNTFAVLGCGPDICYPREHQGLYQDIQKQGGIISEYVPKTPPFSANFPARNRIISGLSDVILVMEAREKSGSLITADMALEQGRDVYALPGPADSPLSQGCHLLISQGAGILISPSDLLKQMHISVGKLDKYSCKRKKELERPENIVYSCLDLYPKGLQKLVEETKLSPEQIIRDLISLELEGKVKEISKNHYVKKG